MDLVSRDIIDMRAVGLTTAVEAVASGAYKNEKRLARIQADALRFCNSWGSSTPYFADLLHYAHNVDLNDFEAIFPFLLTFYEAMPEAKILTEGGSLPENEETELRHQLQGLLEQRKLYEIYGPQPQVEQWIAGVTAKIGAMLKSAKGLDQNNGAHLAQLVLGTLASLRVLMAGAGDIFRQSHPAEKEFNLVARGISHIRRAVIYTLIRDVLATMPQAGLPGFAANVKNFVETRLRSATMSSRREFAMARHYVSLLEREQGEFREIEEALEHFYHIHLLAESFTGTAFTDVTAEWEPEQRVLPWGMVSLCEPFDEKSGRMAYYTADGAARMSAIELTHPDSPYPDGNPWRPLIPDIKETFAFRSAIDCQFDDDRKPYVFHGADALAPPPQCPEYAEMRRTLTAVDRHFCGKLLALWEEFPELFSVMDVLGPLLFIRTNEGLVLVFRSEHQSDITASTGTAPDDPARTEEHLRRYGIAVTGEWRSTLVNAVETVEEALPETSPDDPKYWRAKIRTVRKNIPSLDWLIERLKRLGEVDESEKRGKGSHGLLSFRRHGVQHHHNTWQSIRGTEAIHRGILYEILHTFCITEREFYETCLVK